MIRARLMVPSRLNKDEGGNPIKENWGEFDFDTLPRPGDRVSVVRDDDLEMVIVEFVAHFPVPFPEQETLFPSMRRKAPVQHIIAKAW